MPGLKQNLPYIVGHLLSFLVSVSEGDSRFEHAAIHGQRYGVKEYSSMIQTYDTVENPCFIQLVRRPATVSPFVTRLVK